MKVYEESFPLVLPQDPNRSKGLHLSDILRDLAFMTGILDAKFDIPIKDADSTMMQVGLAWENYLSTYQHPEIEFHGGELSLDGISMSPDGLSIVDDEDYADMIQVDAGTCMLHEFKMTRKSSRGFRDLLKKEHKKARLWLWQIKAYRHALNQRKGGRCDVAKLHAMFVNGNYSHDEQDPEGRPTYKIFRMHFEESELQSNWDMILSHRDYMKEKGAI